MSRSGILGEVWPWHGRACKALLAVLMLLGCYALLTFGDFWFREGANAASPGWFVLLSFAVFWKPVRGLYTWWLFFWIDLPGSRSREAELPPWQGTVDVITTAMPGEPVAMFKRTLRAIRAIEGLRCAYLLDGSNRDELRSLCGSLGIAHVDCRGIEGAKAGKINHCLEHHSTADLVVVLDPDHIPKPDFVRRVRAPFADATVGFVQVVQAYGNLRESWVAWAAAEQTFGFYGPTLMGLSGLGIPTAIGANCTFRRAALDSIGGHAVHLAEDALTSMRIHARGWRSAYLPWRGSYGLVPADLSTFWKQQLKWAAGMTQLLLREYPKLFPYFGPLERIHYFFAGTYYLGSVAAALAVLLPVVFLLFGVQAVQVTVMSFAAHLGPFVLFAIAVSLVSQCYYTHREEWGIPWRSMLLDYATWPIYCIGFASALVGRSVPYLPTPKEGRSLASPWWMLPHWASVVLSLSAIFWAWTRGTSLSSGTLLMVSFAGMNVLLLLPVIVYDSRQRFARTRGGSAR